MRWSIEKPKESIICRDFAGHTDRLEMSGEQVSAVIKYGESGGVLAIRRSVVFPMLRTHPDRTEASFIMTDGENALGLENEKITLVRFDGVLRIFTETGNISAERRLFPSAAAAAFYEEADVANRGSETLTLEFEPRVRIDTQLCCEGCVYAERICDRAALTLRPGEKGTVRFTYTAHFANEPAPSEENPLGGRYSRVRELRGVCDLTTGNDTVDTLFSFAKIRAGESLFRTRRGLIHCPGGLNYYAAVWCNDQCEYAAPWFAFTGDRAAMEASENSFRMYEPYVNDALLPIPSSIISQGREYWNGAHDRGDASMILYGLCRYLLTAGIFPDSGQKRLLDFCLAYIDSKITPDGVIESDTDELENRISSGINLNTSSLTYGGWQGYALLLERAGDTAGAARYREKAARLAEAAEKYFGAEVSGYRTYAYHRGCGQIRAWNCMPVYMGFSLRAGDTLEAIDRLLWHGGSCRSTEGEEIVWDRSALYYLASLFTAGRSDLAWERLCEYSGERLLGEHVPYPVEAYPEGNGRHLSAESALYCRIITDGMFGIKADGSSYAPVLSPSLPRSLGRVTLDRVYFGGEYRNLEIGT